MDRVAGAAALTVFFFAFPIIVCAQESSQREADAPAAADAGSDSAPMPARPIAASATTVEVKATLNDVHTALAPVPQIAGEEIRSSAGTYGDVSRYLQVLPGVVWNSDLSNDVLVRGGHPEENLFVIDGVEFAGISHLALSGTTGGFTSMIDSTAVGGMEMRPGVYDASYSSRLSSLIEIRTRTLGEARQQRIFSLGISGVGGLYQRELPGSGTLLLSAHRSILNLFTNDIGINGVPTYSNALVRVDFSPGSRDSVTLLGLAGADSITMTPCPADRAVTSLYQTQYTGWRETGALTWKHAYNTHVASDLTAEYGIVRQDIGQQQQLGYLVENGHNTCAPASTESTYTENSRNQLPRVNYTLRAGLGAWLLTAGGAFSLLAPDDSVTQPIGQLSPFSASTTATDAVSFHRHFSSGEEAGFLQAEGTLAKRWSVLAGTRAEGFAIDGSYALEPRASILYRLNGRQSIHASWSQGAQLPPAMDLVSYSANHALPPIGVRQIAAGMRLWQGGWGTLDAEGYTKQYRREPVSTEFPQLMLFNMVDTLGQSFVWLPLNGSGTANSRGLDAVLRTHWRDRATLQLSASFSHSDYRALDGLRRTGNFDTPVSVSALTSFRLPGKILLNSRESFTSGRVYCPFDTADSLVQDRGIYDLSRINAVRGPAYNRLDVELERRFRFSRSDLELQAGAENVLNRGNLLGYVWLQNCDASSACLNSQGLPILKVDQIQRFPVLSLRYRF
ncbi:MAG: TonB-dependent receptor plug domain-containing protein [Terracidiphilus sp.]